MRRHALRRHARRGAAAVEFALTLPVVIFLLLATIEYGNYFSELSVVTSVARDAARFGAGQPSGTAAQTQGAFAGRRLMNDMGFACGNASTVCTVSTNIVQEAGVDAVAVRIDADYNQLTNAFPKVGENLALALPTRLRARAVYPLIGPR